METKVSFIIENVNKGNTKVQVKIFHDSGVEHMYTTLPVAFGYTSSWESHIWADDQMCQLHSVVMLSEDQLKQLKETGV